MSDDHMANNISQGTVCAEEVRAEETGDLDLSPMLCAPLFKTSALSVILHPYCSVVAVIFLFEPQHQDRLLLHLCKPQKL